MNTITITFSDGTRHQYTGVPDDVTPDAVIARAQQDFAGKKLSAVDRQPEGGTDVSGDSGRGDIGSDAPGVDRPDSVGVPKWGRENPNLYGVAGAAREALGPVIEGLGMAGGTIVGAGGGSAIGGPIGTVAGATAGGTLGYAAGKRLTKAADVALGNVAPESVDEAFRQTGADVVEGATYEMGGQAAGAAIIKGVPYVMKAWRAGGPQKAKIAEIMEKNPESTDIVKYIEKGSGRIGKDKYAIEAIKQGFDDGVVATVKGSTRNDNAAMLRMVNVLKKAQKNARYGALNRPSDIVGNALAKRVSEVERIRRRAGSHLDSVAKSLKGKRVDYSGAIEQFGRDLEKAGVALVRTKSGKIKADFSEADFEGDQVAERLINRMIDRLSSGKAPDAYDVHRAKRFISSQVSYGKQSKGLSAGAENIVKRLRRNLDQALDAQFPEYKKVNDVYGSARSAIDNIQRAAGSSVKMEGANADKALGTVLRRVLSNTQSRVNLIDSMAEVDQVLKTAGKKTGDDLVAQAMFADELDRMFGAAARTSLKGQVEQAVKTGAEAARGRTLTDMAISGGAKLAEVARGINKENAIKSIEELLKRNMAGVK